MQLTIEHGPATESPDVLVVSPRGEIDLATAGELREGLERAESTPGAGLVVDLSGVGFIDSTGIGELVGCHRRCRDRGHPLAFVVPDGTISKILRVTGMDSVFDIHADVASAAAAVADRTVDG